MYTPKHFEQTDAQILQTVMRENPFAILASGLASGKPAFSHLPFVWEAGPHTHGRLLFHMARANPQWRVFVDDPQVTVLFSGPHAYVTPSWYADSTSVPTWNYVAVHAHGRVRFVEDASEIFSLMKKLVTRFESEKEKPWNIEQSMPNWEDDVRAIVGLEIDIENLEGKFKLNQNRDLTDRQNVAENLAQSEAQRERDLARWMRQTF